MGNLTIATIFIVMVNVLMWFSTIAMININPNLDSGSMCYSAEGSILGESISTTDESGVLNNDVLGDLPGTEGTVSEGTGNVFTDVFKNVLGWFKTSVPGAKYAVGVVAAPYNILKCMGLPNQFVTGLGTLWYLVTLLVLIAFIWGRD